MMQLLSNEMLIIDWLEKYRVQNYRLKADKEYGFIVNVNGDVDLSNKGLTAIAVKFGIVDGNFSCNKNNLTSLLGCPNDVRGDFFCCYNNLIDLKYCPENVANGFYCYYNKIKTLDNLSTVIKGNLNCAYNDIASLNKNIKVGGTFYIYGNNLLKKYPKILSKEKMTIVLEEMLLRETFEQQTNKQNNNAKFSKI